jgi:Zyg-11 family protein
MHSPHIDVSYFAAGIVAHLASDIYTEKSWDARCKSKLDMVTDLVSENVSCLGRDKLNSFSLQFDVVRKWKTPDEEMVAYRSFRPFFPLMETRQPFPVQMWAMWAIHHVCTKNCKKRSRL